MSISYNCQTPYFVPNAEVVMIFMHTFNIIYMPFTSEILFIFVSCKYWKDVSRSCSEHINTTYFVHVVHRFSSSSVKYWYCFIKNLSFPFLNIHSNWCRLQKLRVVSSSKLSLLEDLKDRRLYALYVPMIAQEQA